jgi:predicted NUDIX family NTP pyrophosphohydrolase
MGIKTFDEYLNESWEEIDYSAKKNAAGVAIVWQNSILMVHPTGASWQKNTFGIPKGGIEEGEDPLDAAVRELSEEVGISIDPSQLDPEPLVANNYNRAGVLKWQLVYFVLKINDLEEIGLIDARVPKEQLQTEEVDWAGFVPIEYAYSKIHRSQFIILDRLR